MIEAFCDLADRRMEEAAAAEGIAALRLSQRVRALVALRLRQNEPAREAIRRALAILALPRHARLAARITARTVNAIWYAAGDRSADMSWYSKRAILAGVYSATLAVLAARPQRGCHRHAGLPRSPPGRGSPDRQAAGEAATGCLSRPEPPAERKRYAPHIMAGRTMRYILLWLLGIPIPVLILIWLFMR